MITYRAQCSSGADTGPPHVTPALLARLTTLDYQRRFASAAADERTGHGVATARYGAIGDGVADVAVVVDPAWRPVAALLALTGGAGKQLIHEGIAEVIVALDRERSTRPYGC